MSGAADYRALKAWGASVGRAGMSQAALDVIKGDPSYKGVMEMAGAMKAIAIAAQQDDYWNEQVQRGFDRMLAKATGDTQ